MNRIFTVFVVLIFLVGNIGLTVSSHYCGGHLSDVSFYFAATCGCGDSQMDSDCCQTKSDFVQLDEDFTVVTHDLNLDSELIFEIGNNCFDLSFQSEHSLTEYLNYKPPLIGRDIPMLVQSFLI